MTQRAQTQEQRTVLFVDDDEIVLRSIERGLMDESYKKLFAKSCKQALEILQQEKVHVVVTDMLMPEMTGLELLSIVREKHPKIIRIILSGYMQDDALQNAVNQEEIYEFIPKPWKLGGEEFETVIQQALKHYNSQLNTAGMQN
ncbi:MAG: response regulator [Phycisphaerales bacterium]|jgi:DNA-binding NtrC family response regulator